MTRISTLTFAASLALILGSAQAYAHAQLQKATPAVGGTVASANEIRLKFSEGVEARFSGLTLSTAGVGAMPLGQPTTEGGDKSVLIVPIVNALPPGVYTVHWHAVSVDTHRTQGDFSFTVKR